MVVSVVALILLILVSVIVRIDGQAPCPRPFVLEFYYCNCCYYYNNSTDDKEVVQGV